MKQTSFTSLALVHAFVAFVNLWFDFPSLAGDSGLIPCREIIRSISSEYSWMDIMKFFPSLILLMDPMDLIGIGIACSVIGIVVSTDHLRNPLRSTVLSRVCCGSCWIILVSFSYCKGILLWFPWDCLLLESLFLCAVVPRSEWVFRFLLFRVMFGFGKHKFLGSDSWEDLTYTASMSCWQPLGTSLSWYMTWLPDIVHIGSIIFTFVVEIVCPFTFLVNSSWRAMSVWATIALMLSIQLTGHFGWFNTLTASLAYSVLPNRERSQYKSPQNSSGPSLVKSSVRSLYIITCVIFLIPSQWNSPSLFYQHSFDFPQFDFLRVASAYRVVHTYGVFPPKKMPMIKPVGRFEVQYASEPEHHHPLEYVYQTSHADSGLTLPFTIAPFRFPRFDYIYAFYAASHVWSLSTRLGPTVGTGEEYIESAARALLRPTETLGQELFKTKVDVGKVTGVRFVVVGLVPNKDGWWEEKTFEIDRVWSRSDLENIGEDGQESFTDSLPPNMISLRRKSKVFAAAPAANGSGRYSSNRMFDEAVKAVGERQEVEGFLFEKEWFAAVNATYEEMRRVRNMEVLPLVGMTGEEPALWNIAHSVSFGGYIGCLTSLHLIPRPMHSPLCPFVMERNRELRRDVNSSDYGKYTKIPLSPFIYAMLGMPPNPQ